MSSTASHRFDTRIKDLKNRALKAAARHEWAGTLLSKLLDLPKELIPGKKPTMRCCIYKERAIMTERVRLALGGDANRPNVVEVIDVACDDCPQGGCTVSDACRGCLAHWCEGACPRGAISFGADQKAVIDKSRCINCGKCAAACPYSAIVDRKRPCEKACKLGAISAAEDGSARIDDDKCISCGACVYQCPFGAISDKSAVVNVVDMLKESQSPSEGGAHVHAIVAPAIAGQFAPALTSQVVTGLLQLGFHGVYEVALGADMVAWEESLELAEKGFLMSSCCPAFVTYVRKNFPALADRLSTSLSPMGVIAKYLKQSDPGCEVVFIGPCITKKAEARLPEVSPYVNEVLTFEELQAICDSRDIDVASLPPSPFRGASCFGRGFARSGGVSEAMAQGLREHGVDFAIKPFAANGIEECRKALSLVSLGKADFNFLEGMACPGGCINGPGCMTHSPHHAVDLRDYCADTTVRTIEESRR